MKHQSTITYRAWKAANEVVATFRHLLRDEEVTDAHEAAFRVILTAMQKLVEQTDRITQRLTPSNN